MRRLLSAAALFVFLAAFAPLAYHFIASPNMVLPEALRVETLCAQAIAKFESQVAANNQSSLLSVFSQRLLPVRPQGIHFEFYLVNSNPDAGVYTWEFAGRVQPGLQDLLGALTDVLDVSVSARTVLFAKLGGKPVDFLNSVNETVSVLGTAALKRFVNSNSDWTTGSAVDASGRAILRFAVVIPDPSIVKHALYVKNSQGDLRKGFVQSRWGAVTFVQPTAESHVPSARELSDNDYRLIVESVSSQISQFFGFVDAGSVHHFKDALLVKWASDHLQVGTVASAFVLKSHCDMTHLPVSQATCKSLTQTVHLAENADYMAVSEDVSTAVLSSMSEVEEFMGALESGKLSSTAVSHIRAARRASEVAAYHPKMVALAARSCLDHVFPSCDSIIVLSQMRHMYLPPEHVAALLLPFWVPFVTPLLLALIGGIARQRRKAKDKQKQA
jgi:hypothetical protein